MRARRQRNLTRCLGVRTAYSLREQVEYPPMALLQDLADEQDDSPSVICQVECTPNRTAHP